MTEDPTLARLRAANPLPLDRAERAAGAPWVATLRDRILAVDPGPVERRRTRPWPLVAAVGLVLAGGGALAANEFRAGVGSAPDTPAGAQFVRDFLQGLREHTPRLPGDDPSNFAPVPGTARVVFSARTPHGEYTIWRARTDGPRGGALLFSSPRIGVQGSHGVFRRLRSPYIVVHGGGASPPAGARELFGQVSGSVIAVRVELKDGSQERAMVADGWFVFTQDFGHAKPTRLVGLDRHGRVVVTSGKGLF